MLAIYKLVERLNDLSEVANEEDLLNKSGSEEEVGLLNKRGRFLYSRRSFDNDQLEKSLQLAKRRFLKSKRSVDQEKETLNILKTKNIPYLFVKQKEF